ncbi:MAG TPA: carboxypeptidase regulatory-like domain-containing protein [Vicinamibacterales bacterium]|nr:carboxypeptidase regulatory-like domain-containing protein [Vicinamibacterales bacterium]
MVLDATSGERLARVRVRLDDPKRETTTNEVGEFAFDDVAPGDHTLTAETVGYRLHRESITVVAGQATTTAIPLTADAVRLSETVTVAADAFAPAVPASPSQTRLGAAEIRNLSSVLLDDPMRSMGTVPGVDAADDYHAAFSVRGAPFSRVAVYLDDVPVHAPTHSFGGLGDGYSISALNDQTLGTITLMSAAPPPAFGGAIGAAMAADTRDGSRDKTNVHASVGISDVNVLGEGPLTSDQRGSWLVAARKSHLAYVTHQLGGNSDEQVSFQDVQAKVAYDLDSKNSVAMHVLAGQSNYLAGTPDVDPTVRFTSNSIFDSRGSTDLVKGGWRFAPSSRLMTTTTVEYQRTRDEALSLQSTAVASTRYTDTGAQLAGTWAWNQAATTRFGYAAHAISQSGTSFFAVLEDPRWRSANAYAGSARTQDTYAEQDWTSSSGRVHATAGVRWQWHSGVDDREWLPFASASFEVAPASKIELGWGRYAQAPEIDMIQLADRGRPLSDERSTHAVAAFEQRLDSQTRLRIEGFDREDRAVFDRPGVYPRLVSGEVTWPSTPPRTTNAYDGYSRGVEVVLQRRSANRLTGWIGYTLTYSRSQDLATGMWFDSDNDTRHTLNAYASYRIGPSVNFSGRLNVASGVPVPGYFSVPDFGTEDSTVTDRRNTSRFPAYERLDLRLNKSFVRDKWKMTLYVEAMNATNHRNLRYMGFGGNYMNNSWARLGSTVPLIPSVGFAVDF